MCSDYRSVFIKTVFSAAGISAVLYQGVTEILLFLGTGPALDSDRASYKKAQCKPEAQIIT